MPAPTTYSFLDVLAGMSGPGGNIDLGAGAGVAEEGISVEPSVETGTMTIGADGSGMHSLIANKSGKVTIRLMKTSPTNQKLQTMYNVQREAGALYGQNTISIQNRSTGDSITAQQVGFAKQPALAYSKEGPMIEWEFNALRIDTILGAGVAA